MSNYVFCHVLKPEDAISVCRLYKLYTKGNNDDFIKMMFNRCGFVTIEDIEEIAKDIHEHSDTPDTVEEIMGLLSLKIQTGIETK